MTNHPHDHASTGQVEYRCERTIDINATPEQIWDAITTANGIAAWMVPATIDPRTGGDIAFQLGDDLWSTGTITAFDSPHRFAYEEPDWPLLAGQDPAGVTPMATEFLIEAVSGGSTILRVVTSAFGTGADWENEFFTDMTGSWLALFDNLRLYVTHFNGQPVTIAKITIDSAALDADTLRANIRHGLAISAVGQHIDVPSGTAIVERVDNGPLLLRLDTTPILIEIEAWNGDTTVQCELTARCFNDADSFPQNAWTNWLAAAIDIDPHGGRGAVS